MRPILWTLTLLACSKNGLLFGGGGVNSDQDPGVQGVEGDGSGDGGGEDTSGVEDTAALPEEGLAVGLRAPALEALDQRGEAWSLREAGAGGPLLLGFGHLYLDQAFDQMLDYLGPAGAAAGVDVVVYLGVDVTMIQADVADAAGVYAEAGVDAVVVSPDPNLVTFNLWADNNPPKLYLLDEDQVITWVSYGYTPEAALEVALGG